MALQVEAVAARTQRLLEGSLLVGALEGPFRGFRVEGLGFRASGSGFRV